MQQESSGENPCCRKVRAARSTRFAGLWEEHQRTIYGQCLLWTRGRHDLAEEVLSRARLRALQNFLDCATEFDRPGGWLHRIALNCFLDLHRETVRRREESLTEEMIYGPRAPLLALGRVMPSCPESRALRRELGEAVQRALLHLPLRLRRTLVLQMYQGLGAREIADRLRINETTVRKRLQEAREALRPLLDGYRGKSSVLPAIPIQRPAPSAYQSERGEGGLEPPTAGFRVVSIPLADGTERDTVLPLRHWASDPEQRRRTLTAYVERHPSGWKKRLELARVEVQRGDLASALEQYGRVAEKQGRHLVALLERMAVLVALGRNTAAAALAAQAQVAASTPADRARLIAEEAIALGDPARALAILETTGGAGHKRRLARLQVALGKLAAAAATLAPLLLRQPADPEALLIRCDLHLALDQKTPALEDARGALAAAPSCAPALARLVVLRASAGAVSGKQGRETARWLERLSILAPRAAETAYARAVWWAERGDRERGRLHLDALVALRPGLARGHFLWQLWLQTYAPGAGAAVSHGPLDPFADFFSGW